MIGPTHKQAEMLAFIKQYTAEHQGVAPSFEQMAAALDLKAKSGAHRLIEALEERGYIRRLHYRARAIEVVEGSALAGISTADLLQELERRRPGMASMALAA